MGKSTANAASANENIVSEESSKLRYANIIYEDPKRSLDEKRDSGTDKIEIYVGFDARLTQIRRYIEECREKGMLKEIPLSGKEKATNRATSGEIEEH